MKCNRAWRLVIFISFLNPYVPTERNHENNIVGTGCWFTETGLISLVTCVEPDIGHTLTVGYRA